MPPRSRYASVVTTAFVGAGLVAFTATQALPDLKNAGEQDLAELHAAAAFDAERDRTIDDQTASRFDRGGDTKVASIDQAATDLWLLPIQKYQVSSPFGWRWGQRHNGIDLACDFGTPIYAPAAGKVILARSYSGYGNTVSIDHGDGIVTLYGHNSSLVAREGQLVKAGDMIARAGSTGYSTGNHLHLEVHINGTATDPVPFFRKHGVDIGRKIEVLRGGVL